MKLTTEARDLLGQSPIGMLALRGGHFPLVNPAVFSFASGSLWLTTSRFAAKTMLARRDPRAAFLVDSGSRAVLLRGAIEVFDPLSVSSQVRAMLDGPGYVLGMAGYALKNAPFVAGYALDITHLPREWLPYNRVVLRLRPGHAEVIEGERFPAAQAARVPAVPAEVSRRLAGVSRGYACWFEGGMPVVRPCFWEVDRGQVTLASVSGRPRAGSPGALVVESHHRFRPSQMVGACIRGTFGAADDGSDIAERYGIEPADVPAAIELRPERVTSWRGFAVTNAVPRTARELRVAQA
ncbi:MAG TPA: pyridoxamine 5'-phosphate oxidase family protein [Candidatus Dormibacteraeota bacterium]|nr:pyridoxamine 5'-phosphate oxidase family protein [Candidatus Dormibacteraeota bacterium]